MAHNGDGLEDVGARLKRLRLAKGFSQRDLSSPGVSYAYISRIEAGARTPSVKALRKLARKLDVTVEYLETGSDEAITDDLMEELCKRAKSPVRISAIPGIVHLRWKRDDDDREARGSSLTEALLEAVYREREVDRVREEIGRLAQQERSLRRG
jgi:transcriptional regulator with XRE-family HTH domain